MSDDGNNLQKTIPDKDTKAIADSNKVIELRRRTGLGIMVCKIALVECRGDIDKAVEHLRIQGKANASARATKQAAEGVVLIRADLETGSHSMLEVNCETDFVGKSDDFIEFSECVAQTILMYQPKDMEALNDCLFGSINSQEASQLTVEEARCALMTKVRENIVIRRFILARGIDAEYSRVEGYIHHNRIGVLVDIQGGKVPLGKDIAMHISWAAPLYLSIDEVPAEVIAKEREILIKEAEQESANKGKQKPADIIEQMVNGRLKKFYEKYVLLEQPYTRDNSMTVGQYLRKQGARIAAIWHFSLGGSQDQRLDNATMQGQS